MDQKINKPWTNTFLQTVSRETYCLTGVLNVLYTPLHISKQGTAQNRSHETVHLTSLKKLTYLEAHWFLAITKLMKHLEWFCKTTYSAQKISKRDRIKVSPVLVRPDGHMEDPLFPKLLSSTKHTGSSSALSTCMDKKFSTLYTMWQLWLI